MPPDRPPNSTRRLQTTPTHARRTPLSYVLPLQLQAVVPPCAQPCLTTYIQEEYKCPSYGIACLCQKYSSEGFTLGELAYLCLNQSCKQTDRKESLDQYNICSNVSGAVQATHTVLTAPAQTSPQTLASTDSAKSSTSRKTTVHLTSPSPRPKSRASGTMHSSVSRRNPKTSAAPAAVPDSSLSSPSSSQLTPADIAGIVLGVLSLVVLILAAIRYRKFKNASSRSYDFVDRAPPRPSSLLHIKRAEDVHRIERDTIHCWQALAAVGAQQYPRHSVRSLGSTRSNPRMANSARLPPRRPERSRAGSMHQRRSVVGDATANMFEDDSVPPVPSLTEYWSRSNTEAAPNATSNIVQMPRPPPTKQAPFRPGMRNPPLSLQIPTSATRSAAVLPPVPIPPIPPAEIWSYNDQRASPASGSRSRDSSGSLLNYYASSEAGVMPSPLVDRPVPIQSERPQVLSGTLDVVIMQPNSHRSRSRKDSAASDTSFESTDDDEPTFAAAEEEEDDKQTTPVQESPVQEPSPRQKTPLSEIRYPKIPRSANQKVPRSPGYKAFAPGSSNSPGTPKPWHEPQTIHSAHSKPRYHQTEWPLHDTVPPVVPVSKNAKLGSSSIAAKRRGENAAHDLELKLKKENTAYTAFQPFNSMPRPPDTRMHYNEARPHQQESPLKGYGRTTSSGQRSSGGQRLNPRKSPDRRNPQAVTSKNPRWEPKLTPTRRGEEFYLQVGVATPMQANFPTLN